MRKLYFMLLLVKCSILPFSLILLPANAQIIPDATLPNNSSIAPSGNTSIINGGTQADGNLFHSFEQFSIPMGGTAYFNNSLSIQNIITRVTGSSISNIDGLIRANGTANLFLLNPNGILFGSNARLNIGGSFLATTANSLNFADGKQFSATTPQTAPLLTVSIPTGLRIETNTSEIRVQGTGHDLSLSDPLFAPFTRGNSTNGLRVLPQKTLALIGGNIALEGSTLAAPGGRVELGSISNGTVSFIPAATGWTFSYENVPSFKDIVLSQKALVDATGVDSGSIQIQGRKVTLTNGSVVLSQNLGVQPGENINLNASDSLQLDGITLDGKIPTSLVTEAFKTGNGGNIEIFTGNLFVLGGARISTRTYSIAKGGNLNLNASDFIQVIGSSPLNPRVYSLVVSGTANSGNAGDITVKTNQLIAQNGGNLGSTTLGTGNGGNFTVNAPDIKLSGESLSSIPSALFSSTANAGNAGKLFINTSRLVIDKGAVITSSTAATGNSGSITINASDFVKLDGTVNSGFPARINSSATPELSFLREDLNLPSSVSGASGDLTINTKQLILQNGAQISASTYSSSKEGKGGDLTINALDSVEVNGVEPSGNFPTGLFTQSNGFGDAGVLTINTKKLAIQDGGGVSAGNTAGSQGKGGDLNINALDSVELSGTSPDGQFRSSLLSRTFGTGAAGNLNIDTNRLIIQNGAEVSVESRGIGNAGNLKVTANSINLENRGKLLATSTFGTDGGNITLNNQDLLLLHGNSEISTTAGGAGNGGNITIDTNLLIASENSDIIANAFEGKGGNIKIAARAIFGIHPRPQQTLQSDITASSQLGINGTIKINNLVANPITGSVNLPVEIVDASNLIAQGCPDDIASGASSLVYLGRGGLPEDPTKPITPSRLWTDFNFVFSEETPSEPPTTESIKPPILVAKPIVAATGWIRNKDGKVVFTAENPTTIKIPWVESTCHASSP